MANCFEDQEGFSQTFTKKFCKRFKSNMTINLAHVILTIQREIDNESLTNGVSDKEIFEAVKQINSLKAPSLYGIEAIFYYKKLKYYG